MGKFLKIYFKLLLHKHSKLGNVIPVTYWNKHK